MSLKKFIAYKGLTPAQREIIKEIESSFTDEVRKKTVKKKSFAPSSLGWNEGKCPRAWFYKFEGADVEETISFRSKSNMETGSVRHEFLQNFLSDNPNLEIEIEVELTNDSPPIRAFADGVIVWDGKKYPLEIKTAGVNGYEYREETYVAADYHKAQIIPYMVILGSEMGFFLYENRDTYDHIIIPIRMADYQEYAEYLFDWMRRVYAAYEENKLPQYFPGKRTNSKVCKECPFKKVCDEDGATENEPIALLELPK